MAENGPRASIPKSRRSAVAAACLARSGVLRQTLHLIVDNNATPKGPAVEPKLVRRERFHLHFVPTPSSWLRREGRWFGRIAQQQICRESFQSVRHRIEAVNELAENDNRDPGKFIWTKDADMILAGIQRCKAA